MVHPLYITTYADTQTNTRRYTNKHINKFVYVISIFGWYYYVSGSQCDYSFWDSDFSFGQSTRGLSKTFLSVFWKFCSKNIYFLKTPKMIFFQFFIKICHVIDLETWFWCLLICFTSWEIKFEQCQNCPITGLSDYV